MRKKKTDMKSVCVIANETGRRKMKGTSCGERHIISLKIKEYDKYAQYNDNIPLK